SASTAPVTFGLPTGSGSGGMSPSSKEQYCIRKQWWPLGHWSAALLAKASVWWLACRPESSKEASAGTAGYSNCPLALSAHKQTAVCPKGSHSSGCVAGNYANAPDCVRQAFDREGPA